MLRIFRNLSENYIFVKSRNALLAPSSSTNLRNDLRNDFVRSSLEIRYYALNPDRTRANNFPIFSGNLDFLTFF